MAEEATEAGTVVDLELINAGNQWRQETPHLSGGETGSQPTSFNVSCPQRTVLKLLGVWYRERVSGGFICP